MSASIGMKGTHDQVVPTGSGRLGSGGKGANRGMNLGVRGPVHRRKLVIGTSREDHLIRLPDLRRIQVGQAPCCHGRGLRVTRIGRVSVGRPCPGEVTPPGQCHSEDHGRPGSGVGVPGVDRGLACGACPALISLPGEQWR